jgi:hypothetical protein
MCRLHCKLDFNWRDEIPFKTLQDLVNNYTLIVRSFYLRHILYLKYLRHVVDKQGLVMTGLKPFQYPLFGGRKEKYQIFLIARK